MLFLQTIFILLNKLYKWHIKYPRCLWLKMIQLTKHKKEKKSLKKIYKATLNINCNALKKKSN